MICPVCFKRCWKLHPHHKLSDTQVWRPLYGKNNRFDGIDWLNHADNLQWAGDCCNTSHAGQGRGLIVWSELQFCEHFNLKPRSKMERFNEKLRFE